MNERASEWSYAQYGLFRRLLGAYLLVHFVMLMPYAAELFSNAGMLGDASLSPYMRFAPNVLRLRGEPWAAQLLVAVGMLASVLLIAGRGDRISAIVLWYVLASLFTRNPLIANPSLPVAGWLLLLHAAIPKPRSDDLEDIAGWNLPRSLLVAAWVVLALSYTYSGYTKLLSPSWVSGEAVSIVLENPLARDHALRTWMLSWPEWTLKGLTWGILYVELLFAPLALIPRFRLWLWSVMLAVQIGFLVLLDFADLTLPMLLIHLLTVEQRWLSFAEKKVPASVYFDGDCALCHGFVRFALVEDRRKRLLFAPLQSDTAIAFLGDEQFRRRMDTIVVRTADGETFERSQAAVEILYRLGGWWAVFGTVLARLPAAIRDRVYELVGNNRRRLGRTGVLCPVVPAAFAQRFLSLRSRDDSACRDETQRQPQ
jgi:predicted DCC family thiol-disulfide oxidoreductase YuxK